jgi:hypothetical protein
MLEQLKDLIRPIRVRDSVFGDLRYLRDARFWEGTVIFAPTGQEVEVLIFGEPTGPTEEQRRFFREATDQYDAIWPVIRERLASEAAHVRARPASEFVLVCVDVPARVDGKPEWELSYETQPPSWHFTVTMQGWTPGHVVAEC